MWLQPEDPSRAALLLLKRSITPGLHLRQVGRAHARRLIIASTSRRSSARPVSRRPAGSTVWKSAAFGSSGLPASTKASRAADARW